MDTGADVKIHTFLSVTRWLLGDTSEAFLFS